MNKHQQDIMDRFGIPADAFFNHYSDMYVGCADHTQAIAVRDGGEWKSMATIFTPQKGSDMDRFPYAVDIPFAYMAEEIEKRRTTPQPIS